MTKLFTVLVLLSALLSFAGCGSVPKAEDEPAATAAPEVPVTPSAPEEKPDPAADETPTKKTEPPPPEPLPPEPQEPDGPGEEDPGDYEVTEEVFERTFSEVEQTIDELNAVIERRDYQTWLTYLTDEYRRTYSDPRRLREISRMPTLQRNDIELRTLRDYFEWVVGPSRANARLDDLRFLNDDHVEAIMVVRDQPVILYRLRNVDGNWKVDVF